MFSPFPQIIWVKGIVGICFVGVWKPKFPEEMLHACWEGNEIWHFGNYTSTSCKPLSFRIFSLPALVLASEACLSTSCIDSGVRSSKFPRMLWRSCCETRHLGHGWLADAARQPQKYAASSASCDSIRMPGYSTRLTPSAHRWASPFCERHFKLWNTFLRTFWYTSLLKRANSSFSAVERLVGSDGSSTCIHTALYKSNSWVNG